MTSHDKKLSEVMDSTNENQQQRSIEAIENQGELLIEALEHTRRLAQGMFAMIATDVPREPDDFNRRIALTRLMEAVGAEPTTAEDGSEVISFETQTAQTTKVNEAVMWAVRGLTE